MAQTSCTTHSRCHRSHFPRMVKSQYSRLLDGEDVAAEVLGGLLCTRFFNFIDHSFVVGEVVIEIEGAVKR